MRTKKAAKTAAVASELVLPPIEDVVLTIVQPSHETIKLADLEGFVSAPVIESPEAAHAEQPEAEIVEGSSCPWSADMINEGELIAAGLDAIEAAPPAAEDQATVDGSFDSVIASFTSEQVIVCEHRIAAVLDKRAAFETEKHDGSSNIQKTLASARKTMIRPTVASVLLATNVDPDVMNRVLHEGSRYNVYAIGKLADACAALGGGRVTNAINNAIMRSLFRHRAAGLVFTGETAKAACSQNIKVADKAVRDALVRHTVSPSTAPTQASSTIQALQTLGIVARTGGTTKNPVYALTNNPVVAKLEEVLAKAA